MEKNKTIEEITRIMLHYYNNDQAKLDTWLRNPHYFILDAWGTPLSPKYLMDNGREVEVLDLIYLTIYKK